MLFWSIFGEIHRKLFFLNIKVTIAETSTEIFKKFIFLTIFERCNYKKKNVFLHNVSHILLNYAYLLFWSIFGEIHRELLFLDIKVTIAETSAEIFKKFVFLTMFEKGQILRKIWISLNICFWSNQLNGKNINKTFFFPQSEPHTAKLCLSVVLKHFWGNS